MRAVNAAAGGGQKSSAFRPAPSGQPQRQAEVADGVDVVNLALPHRRDADFDFRHAGMGKGGGDAVFSARENATPAACSPSRKVVSMR